MQFEIDIIKALQSGRTIFWDMFFKNISLLGSVTAVFFVALLLFVFKKRWQAFWFLVVEGVGYISGFLLKFFISRERPFIASEEVIPITWTKGYSMPSGHSLCAIIMSLCLIYIFWKNKPQWQRALMIASGITFFLIMGLSRMYLGQHYLTDVLVGYTLGYCVCLVAFWARNPVARLVNVLLERMGLEKWKMEVPPMPMVYDDATIDAIKQNEQTEETKNESEKNLNKEN